MEGLRSVRSARGEFLEREAQVSACCAQGFFEALLFVVEQLVLEIAVVISKGCRGLV
jgi:hypothetical protein